MSQPLLQVDRLSVTLGGTLVVDGVSLTLAPGELVALIGPNGSGKTTLIRALLGLVPHGGRVDWMSAGPHASGTAQVAAYLPQSPTAVAGQTVVQTIFAGRFAHRGRFDFVDRTSDAALVSQIADQLGLGPLLDRPVDRLSGGQRQRVFLARCLAQQTPALVLDEPATFLDLRNQVELYRRLQRLADDGKAILMASHDLNLAALHSHRMILLADGKLVADGTPAEVMEPSLIERVYGVRMKRIDVEGIPHLVPVPDDDSIASKSPV